MAIGPINNSALFGIQRGMDNMRVNASKIASASQMENKPGSGQDMTRTLVELHENSHYTKASVKALKTHDATIGFLLDELA